MTRETRIIDGKAAAQKLRDALKQTVQEHYKKYAMTPGLAVVLVGNDPASEVYVGNKVKASREVGINSFERRLPAVITETALLGEIESLNKNPDVHGILVQLPLPKHIHAERIIHAIDPRKDVDGFHPINVGKMWIGDSSALLPCTPTGCMILLKEMLPDLAGKHAVIVGRSNIVGKPIAAMLLAADCTVTVAHSKTKDLPSVVKQADIVIAAVGKPEMIRGEWIKPGACVIDVGINRIERDGKPKLVGDVALEECRGIAAAITPVPGGVGPMTIACLLQNTVKAAGTKI